MKTRIILGNLMVSYILFPMIYIHQYLKNLVTGHYQYYDAYFEALIPYIKQIFQGFFIFSIIFIVASLIPLQILKIKWLYRIKKYYFAISVVYYSILNCVIVVISGWGFLLLSTASPWYRDIPFIVIVIGFSFLIQTALFFLIDKRQHPVSGHRDFGLGANNTQLCTEKLL